jgi:hypothetical protein
MEQNNEIVEQVQAEGTAEVSQPESLETPIQDNVKQEEVDPSKPVYNLDDAKKAIEFSKKKSKPAVEAKSQAEPQVDYQKQYAEIQKLVGRQSTELGQLRKFYQESKPVIDSYRKLLEQQQESQLAEKYNQDPMAVVKELARREALQSVAPYQEQIVQAQASNIHSWIKENTGGDYERYAPVMADVLEEFQQMDAANGSQYAQELAQNPNLLMQLAAGRLTLQQKTETANQIQSIQNKKAANLKAAQGVAKANNIQASAPTEFQNQSLDDMTKQLRSLGIVK